MPPLPVTVLTGFLGAGKTTLLGRLLAEPHGQRVGVILNEIGIAGIDRLGGPVQTSYVELTNGCVCCVDQPDLLAAVDGLVRRGDLDRLVLETTGLADPLPLTWTLSRPELAAVVRLDGVVTVVDAANWRRTQVAEWEAQALGADLVVLSKRDLTTPAEAEALAAHLAGLNPHARLVDGDQGWRLALLGELGSPAPTGAAAPVAHHSRYLAVSFQERCRFDAGAIEDCLAALPREVYRAKGLVRLDDGAWAAFHVVGGRLQVDLDVAAPSDGESRLVFFGEGLERARLDELLAPCRRPA